MVFLSCLRANVVVNVVVVVAAAAEKLVFPSKQEQWFGSCGREWA
jgi:hypothetical protein